MVVARARQRHRHRRRACCRASSSCSRRATAALDALAKAGSASACRWCAGSSSCTAARSRRAATGSGQRQRVRRHAAARSRRRSRPARRATRRRRRGRGSGALRVLVVDDNRDAADSLAMLLRARRPRGARRLRRHGGARASPPSSGRDARAARHRHAGHERLRSRAAHARERAWGARHGARRASPAGARPRTRRQAARGRLRRPPRQAREPRRARSHDRARAGASTSSGPRGLTDRESSPSSFPGTRHARRVLTPLPRAPMLRAGLIRKQAGSGTARNELAADHRHCVVAVRRARPRGGVARRLRDGRAAPGAGARGVQGRAPRLRARHAAAAAHDARAGVLRDHAAADRRAPGTSSTRRARA